MQTFSAHSPWRANFIGGMRLLAQATARLPFGVPDPVLGGGSAVELYTGGMWSSEGLEVLAAHPRPLVAELFAVGFRWRDRPRPRSGNLWHPDCQIGIDIIEPSRASDAAELANRVVVANDLRPEGPADTAAASLQVVGIEDLMAQQVQDWLADGARSGDCAVRVQALLGLGPEGVGGALRGGYLQRRVAWESGGEVMFELPSSAAGVSPCQETRTIGLTRIAR